MGKGLRFDHFFGQSALRTILGFACNQGFIFSLFYLGINRSFPTGPFAFERADLFLTLLFMLCAFVLVRIASPRARDALLSRNLLWFYAVLLVLGSIVASFDHAGILGIIVEGFLVGTPAGLMLVVWGRVFDKHSLKHCIPEVFVAAGVASLICLALALIPLPGAIFALKLLPLGSALALRSLIAIRPHRFTHSQQPSDHGSLLTVHDLLATHDQRFETTRLSKKIMAGTILFGLTAGFMETFASDPGMSATPTFAATLVLLILFCLAALQLIAAPRPWDPQNDDSGSLEGVYRLAILVMMAGFLFVPALDSFGVSGDAIVLTGYLGLTYVLVSLFVVMARLTGQDAALFFARGFAMLYLGEVAGIVLGNGIEFAEPAGQIPFLIASFAGLATLYAYLFLFTGRDFTTLSVIVDDADHFSDACQFIASEHGLSKREAEILTLALRGRSGERIATEFFISKSTVDTHLRRIYAKTGVHGRQELIDLGEQTLKHLAER